MGRSELVVLIVLVDCCCCFLPLKQCLTADGLGRVKVLELRVRAREGGWGVSGLVVLIVLINCCCRCPPLHPAFDVHLTCGSVYPRRFR